MMDGTTALNENVIKLNRLDPDTEYSWSFEGLDTEPYVFLYIGDAAKVRGTLHDLTELTGDMVDDLADFIP